MPPQIYGDDMDAETPQTEEPGDAMAEMRKRLSHLYGLCLARGNLVEARRTLQELRRFMPEQTAEPGLPSAAELELEQVVAHLEPLNLAEPGTVAVELARLAACKIIYSGIL